jgi:hypothetical protein
MARCTYTASLLYLFVTAYSRPFFAHSFIHLIKFGGCNIAAGRVDPCFGAGKNDGNAFYNKNNSAVLQETYN